MTRFCIDYIINTWWKTTKCICIHREENGREKKLELFDGGGLGYAHLWSRSKSRKEKKKKKKKKSRKERKKKKRYCWS
jgi:hypothetical protein